VENRVRKIPLHPAPTYSRSLPLSRSFRIILLAPVSLFNPLCRCNRRRGLYLSAEAQHRCVPPLPLPLLSLQPRYLPSRSPSSTFFPLFILALLKGTYICMAACTPPLCEILEASIARARAQEKERERERKRERERRLITRCQQRASSACTDSASMCCSMCAHVRTVRVALVNLINPTDISGTNADGQRALPRLPR